MRFFRTIVGLTSAGSLTKGSSIHSATVDDGFELWGQVYFTYVSTTYLVRQNNTLVKTKTKNFFLAKRIFFWSNDWCMIKYIHMFLCMYTFTFDDKWSTLNERFFSRNKVLNIRGLHIFEQKVMYPERSILSGKFVPCVFKIK